MKAQAAAECFPPTGEREVRNLQNFSSLNLLEEENNLGSEEEGPFPDAHLDDWESIHLIDCHL